MRFPPKALSMTAGDEMPLVVASFGSGLLFQEFTHVCMLIQAGYSRIRVVLVDTLYVVWRRKHAEGRLVEGGRVYCEPTVGLRMDMVRPWRTAVPGGWGGAEATQNDAAQKAIDAAVSFAHVNEAVFQFVQWFATEPGADVQVLLYDSVDGYVAYCKAAPTQFCAHVLTAVDYKDGARLLEGDVGRMAKGCLRADGVVVKVKTPAGARLPEMHIENRRLRVVQTLPLTDKDELHFEARCHDCDSDPDGVMSATTSASLAA